VRRVQLGQQAGGGAQVEGALEVRVLSAQGCQLRLELLQLAVGARGGAGQQLELALRSLDLGLQLQQAAALVFGRLAGGLLLRARAFVGVGSVLLRALVTQRGVWCCDACRMTNVQSLLHAAAADNPPVAPVPQHAAVAVLPSPVQLPLWSQPA